jgi:arsenate reductase
MQRYLRSGLAALLTCSGLTVGAAAQSPPSAATSKIVFVCEHGAAKSVIATAYFNKIAAERGLPDRAIYRGANPQAELSVSALKGLKEDGLTLPSDKPSPITSADVSAATHIFAIGCMLPAHAASSGKAESWNDVPDDRGYAAQRDAIKKHVERLLDQLQKR